jgi:hypothetical protein
MRLSKCPATKSRPASRGAARRPRELVRRARRFPSGSFLSELMKRVVENARVDNLEAMFARYNKLEANNEGYFQDYDLSSYETVETISKRKTVAVSGPVEGQQLALM